MDMALRSATALDRRMCSDGSSAVAKSGLCLMVLLQLPLQVLSYSMSVQGSTVYRSSRWPHLAGLNFEHLDRRHKAGFVVHMVAPEQETVVAYAPSPNLSHVAGYDLQLFLLLRYPSWAYEVENLHGFWHFLFLCRRLRIEDRGCCTSWVKAAAGSPGTE